MTSLQTFAEIGEPSVPRQPSALFLTCAEVYLGLAIAASFGVLGVTVIGDQRLMWPMLSLLGFGVLAIAPTGALARSRVNLAVLLMCSWFVLSAFWTADLAEWRRGALRLGVVPLIVMLLVSMVPFERVIAVIQRLTLITFGLIFVSVALSPSTTTQHLPAENEPVLPGWHGTFDHKNDMMAFLVFGMITFFVYADSKRQRDLVIGGTLLLGVLGQSGTGLATVVVVLSVGLFARRYQQLALVRSQWFMVWSVIGWSIAVVALIFAAPFLVNLYGKDLTLTGRTQIWTASLAAVGDAPWLGYGLGSVWINDATQPTATMLRVIGFRAGHAHNGAIELLLQVGAIGLGLYLVVVATVARQAWIHRRIARLPARWSLMFLVAFAQFSFAEAVTIRGYWLVLVMLAAVPYRSLLDGPGAEQ